MDAGSGLGAWAGLGAVGDMGEPAGAGLLSGGSAHGGVRPDGRIGPSKWPRPDRMAKSLRRIALVVAVATALSRNQVEKQLLEPWSVAE